MTAADVHLAQRLWLAFEHEEHAWTRTAHHAAAHRLEPRLHLADDAIGFEVVAGDAAKLADRIEDCRDAAMAIGEGADAGASDLLLQVGLGSVHDDEIRPQRQDALGIGVE